MAGSIVSCFARLEDPRGDRGKRHLFPEIMVIAVLAVICGAAGFEDMEEFGKAKRDWLGTFLKLPGGIPSHDTFGRVFAALHPDRFEACFRAWIASVAGEIAGIVNLDGKTLRRTLDRANKKSAIHMVSAWVADNRLVFGQVATDQKSNEITAIPALLRLLEIKGLIVTIDAMGCQKQIAQQIVQQGGDYVLAVKDNQAGLHADIEETFRWSRARGFKGVPHAEHEETEKGHGRIETRRVTVVRELALLRDAAAWTGLACLVEAERKRTVLGAGPDGVDKTSTERCYFISSLKTHGAEELARACRAHWGIENGLHWRLDVAFREDESRIRTGYAAENYSRVNRIALDLLMMEPSKKSIRRKRLRAGWDLDYLLAILRIGAE